MCCCFVVFFTFYKTRLPLFLSDHCSSFLIDQSKTKKHDFFLLKKLPALPVSEEIRVALLLEAATKTNDRVPDWLATIWHGFRDVFIVVVQLWRVMLSNLLVLFFLFFFCGFHCEIHGLVCRVTV